MKLPDKIIFFDTETTGKDLNDEILSLAIVDQDGKVLFNELIRPSRKKKWPEAARVHYITPDMVKNRPTFRSFRKQVQDIFDQAQLVVGYDAHFAFIGEKGIRYSGPFVDVQVEFAKMYSKWGDDLDVDDYKWQKLITCASRYGYDWGYSTLDGALKFQNLTTCACYYGYNWGDSTADGALADALATRFCFYKVWDEIDGNVTLYHNQWMDL